ncbi:MAG: glycoside hydrolase family 43 protein [Pseudoxanthomonas sp.]
MLDEEFADPFVLPLDDGSLVAFSTNRRGPDGQPMHIPSSSSRDAVQWTAPVDAMPQVPAWARQARPDLWAPEALQVGERYVLFFSARHATNMRPDGLTLCLGAAVATQPGGPYIPQPEPLTCGGAHGVIDVSPFRDRDAIGIERLWLLYKTDGNCCGTPTTFVVQRLSADGLALVGPPQVIEGAVNDADWEGHVVEAPQMVEHAGKWYLFYAGNDYGSGAYATGYARCAGPRGPCRDAEENPILRSRGGDPPLVGPGHQSVFEHAGRSWIAYHGWRPATATSPRYRAMYVQHLAWRDGRPVPGE